MVSWNNTNWNFEDFEILKYKRKGGDAEDIVEEDALARLKGRFGRL